MDISLEVAVSIDTNALARGFDEDELFVVRAYKSVSVSHWCAVITEQGLSLTVLTAP